MTTPSQRLRNKIALVRPQLQDAAGQLWTHPRLAQLLPDYLGTVHCVIRASEPLLRLAAQECGHRSDADATIATLGDYFARHADEEVEHDSWLLDDLEALGVARHDVLHRLPSSSVVDLVGAQYYWIQHYHPAAFLGYLAVLERPVDPEYYEKVIARTGLPRDGFRSLLHHATVDDDHARDIDTQMDRLSPSSSLEAAIGMNALATVASLAQIYRDVVETAEAGLADATDGR